MNGTEPTRAALWARVSTSDQKTANQVDVLRDWAQRRGLDIAAEFITEDSAWQNGNGAKGKEFDRTRDELINGARLGHYTVVLVWAVDRLSRRGIEDTLATMRRLYEHGCDIWSHQEPWLVTSEPRMRELLVSFMAWMAEQESARRSERIKAGMARSKREGKPVGGRPAGSRDRKPRGSAGYRAAWSEDGARREASERQARTLTCQNPDCGKEFTSTATTPPKYCSENCRENVRRIKRAVEGSRDALALFREAGVEMPAEWARVAHARAGSPEAGWDEIAAGLGMTREHALTQHRLMLSEAGMMQQKAAQRSAEVGEALAVLRKAGVPGAGDLLAEHAAQENGSGQ